MKTTVLKNIAEIKTGDILAEDVDNKFGAVIANSGTKITKSHINSFKKYGITEVRIMLKDVPQKKGKTEIPDEYEPLLPRHPFVKATIGDFKDVLQRLLIDKALRQKKQKQGLAWVRDFPHPRRIMSRVYEEYRKLGWK